jgi:23S rRNA (uracil1939-C5)-methyltransferase
MKRLTLQVERLIQGGRGLARLRDGRVCLVAGVLPGETVQVQIHCIHRDWVEARLLDIENPSPQRVHPQCPLALRCGGCPLAHIAPDAQAGLKGRILAETLDRLGGIPGSLVAAPVPSPRPWGYRHRLRLHVSPNGRIGFLRPGSHLFVPVDTCHLATETVQQLQAGLNTALVWPDIASKVGTVGIVTDPDTGESSEVSGGSLVLRARKGAAISAPALHSLKRQIPGLQGIVLIPGSRKAPAHFCQPLRRWPYPAAALGLEEDLVLISPPQCFTQINWDLNLKVIRRILDLANSVGAERVLDLYAGIGNFTFALAAAGHTVLGVEEDPLAVRWARRSARSLGLAPLIGFVAGRVEDVLAETLTTNGPWDLVLIDPPRAGAKAVSQILARHQIQTILYLSCDAATLARDLQIMKTAGYEIQHVEPYDFFSQTAHMESLVLLSFTG